jgi:hypothetical protein
MTRVRFLSAVLAAIGAGVLATAAPVPKGAGQTNPTPDVKVALDTVGKAVKDEKWPAEAEEKLLRDTARVIFERATKAAEQKDRKLPVDFANLTKLDVTGDYKGKSLDGNFLIAKDVRVTGARNSVIFASGDVQITSAQNCVVVAQNVRCTGVDNCVVVAGDYIRLTVARRRDGADGSVLIAGQWLRATVLDGAVCHVIRPGGLPSPDEGKFAGNQPHPAISTNGAKNVIYLNDRAETRGGDPDQQTYIPQMTPIAK